MAERIAKHLPIGSTMRIGGVEDPAHLFADQHRQHVDRKGVPQHVRRDSNIETEGLASLACPAKSNFPGSGRHGLTAFREPERCVFRHPIRRSQQPLTVLRTEPCQRDAPTAAIDGVAAIG